jgi:hypothetical protein
LASSRPLDQEGQALNAMSAMAKHRGEADRFASTDP